MSARQLPLALRYPPDQRLETYVGAPAGAIGQLRAWAEGRSPDWLFLAGPAGVGKTHLALAACAAAEQAGRAVAYLPVKAAAGGRLAEALQSVADEGMLVLDGLEAMAGRADEIAVFEVHNRLRDTGGALLYTAQASPDRLPLTLPDLRSRLAQCTRLALTMLDERGRREVLVQRAQRRGLVLEDAALGWLLRRVGRDLAGLAGLMDRLDQASMAEQRRITVPFLRRMLG